MKIMDWAIRVLLGTAVTLGLALALHPVMSGPAAPAARTMAVWLPAESGADQHQDQAALDRARVMTQKAVLTVQQATAVPQPAPPPPPPPPAPVVVATTGTDYAASAFGECVRTRENGGSYAWGTGDGGGAYQFELGTWLAHGGTVAEYGSAALGTPAVQDQVFNNTVAADGDSPWAPYDGCTL